MQRLRYWRPLAAALLVCLAVPGCGISGHAVAGGSRSSSVTGNQSPTATDSVSAATGSGKATRASRPPVAPVSGKATRASRPPVAPVSSTPAATGGGNVPGGPQPHGSAEAKGAPQGNAPKSGGGGGGPTAPGAPIAIPDVIEGQGVSIDDVRNSFVTGDPLPGESNSYNGIIAQCGGGKLCVTIAVKPGSIADGADGFTECQYFGKTDPPAGSVVHPGDTIWLLTGTLPCTSSSGSGQSSSPASGQSSAPGTDQSSAPAADQSSADTSSP
jgi:hypothetical protein